VVGEDGENVELAEQLTGWTIDVRRVVLMRLEFTNWRKN